MMRSDLVIYQNPGNFPYNVPWNMSFYSTMKATHNFESFQLTKNIVEISVMILEIGYKEKTGGTIFYYSHLLFVFWVFLTWSTHNSREQRRVRQIHYLKRWQGRALCR